MQPSWKQLWGPLRKTRPVHSYEEAGTIPSTLCTSFADRSFAVAAPTVWNSVTVY